MLCVNPHLESSLPCMFVNCIRNALEVLYNKTWVKGYFIICRAADIAYAV
jgi:hypothetical protein